MPEVLLNGRYRVERKLGEGGMGEVFEVRDTVDQERPLAYKLLKAQGGNLEYFKHEFKLLARLDHPNLVKVYDFGITEGGCYYTCELLDGLDLYRATDGIDWDGLFEISRQVLEGLAYIHDRGLVHYDVKPENLNVRVIPPPRPGAKPSYVVKLVDFGLTGEATTRGGGKIKGTVHYIAPEVAKEQPADHRADLYSFGITLYYAVTRKLPYDGGSAFSVIRKHLERIPEPPTSIRHDIPEGWARFILKLLEKDPADRYPSAEAALNDLARRLGRPSPMERSSAHVQASQPVLSSRFVGRARELDILSRALPDPATRDKESPLLVLVAGEGGIGKSRLLDELKVVSQLKGVPFLKAECRETAGSAPLERVVRQVLTLEGSRKKPDKNAPEPSFADRDERGSSGERLGLPPLPIHELVKSYQAELEALFPGITDPPSLAEEGAREPDRRLVHDRVAHFLVRAARARPFVLAVEDVHWADEATLGLLEALARNVLFDARKGTASAPEPLPGTFPTRRVAPVLIILTLRLEEALARTALKNLLDLAPVSPGPLRARRLELARLDEKETTAVASSMLALAQPNDPLGKKLHDASGGNPFFVEELVRSLLDDGVLIPRRGLARPEDLSRVEPPRTLAELLGRRLAALGDEARVVLQTLALLGRPSPLGVLGPAAGLSTEKTLDALDQLADKQLALRTAPDPDASTEEGPRFSVAHAQIQRAALRSLDPAAERALHLRSAVALEKFLATTPLEREATLERLARHFALAGDARKALDYSVQAGDRATHAHRNEEAIEHFDRAIDLLRSSQNEERRATMEPLVLEKLGDALSTVGRYGDAARVLEALARSPAIEDETAVRVRRRLGAVALKRGDYETATQWLKDALTRIGERAALRRERARVLQNMARIGLWRGDYLQAIALATEALDLWRVLKAQRERLVALNVLSSAEYYRGRYTRSAQLLRESLELARHGETTWSALLRDMNVEDEMEKGIDDAIAQLKRGGALRRGAGDAYGIVLSFSELGTYCDLRGDAPSNIRFYESSIQVYERMGNSQGLALSFNNLGVYRRLQGEAALALDAFERALAIHEGTNDRHGGACTLQNLAMLRLALGDLDGAVQQARRALAFAKEIGIGWLMGHSHRLLGKVAAARGDREAAEQDLTRAEGVFRRLGNPRSLGDVLLDRAELALDQKTPAAALDLIERARKTGDEEKGEDFLARQRLIQGLIQLDADPPRAIDDLDAALGYAEKIGVVELRLDVHRALVAAHARHRSIRLAVRHADRARELEERIASGLPHDLQQRMFRSTGSARARDQAKQLQERLLGDSDEG
jgi:serine/threonine protein kinase/tetratricopeptide (TPR) repeat protein